ncbi:ABC transporter permease [Streptomyces sp. NPDC059802]|uniref:ABC transporter permease n=1 Tax=Streptomyces sp. NPDC059802 TaxID=3346952 RepID=UPI00364799AC
MNGTPASVRLSIASLRAHKRRFAGTFVAVLLGVAFLTGTLVMGDTLRASFDTMFADANAGTDAVVRGSDVVTVAGETQGTRQPVSTALVKRIERTPGVAAAAPDIQGAGQLIGSDGRPIGGQGPPTLAGNWIADPELNPYRLAAGRAPAAPGEVVVNRGTADRGGLRIGDTTVLRTPDPVHVTIVGLATFGGQDGMGQVTYTAMTQADAEKYLTPKPGQASAIQVRAGPGTSQRELVDALRPVLPKGVEAVTGQVAAAENRDMISGAFLGLFTTLLLVFSGIVLLVATFSIHNTFAIVVAQRTRENALLRALGAPLDRLRGVSGRLARRNALRSPRRTASTATALMIGVAVVSLFTVFGASLKATMNQTVDRSFAGDVAISAPAFGAGGSGLSPRLAPAVDRLPQVATAVGLGKGVAEVDGAGRALTVTDPAALGRVFDLGRVDGSLTGLGTNGIAVSGTEAAKRGLHPGSSARLAFTDGTRRAFTVRAVYERSELAGDYVITRQAWAPHRAQDSDSLIAVSFRPGVSVADGKAAVAKTAAAYGDPDVQTRGEYARSSAGGIDMMLTLVYALLALAVLIALLGIANTLTLALHERTREMGLLRAVGQTRGQLRSMVRWESVLVAAFGTAGGLLLGGFLGWVLVEASAGDTAVAFDLPPLRLLVVALVGIAAGALAGRRPARRAARLNVLRAIAAE